MIQGYQAEGCKGAASLASHNETTVDWTWNGVDLGVDVQSFRMYCATPSSP